MALWLFVNSHVVPPSAGLDCLKAELHIRSHFVYEPILGRAVLLHSLNAKAARQRRPTDGRDEVHGQMQGELLS